MNRAQSPISDTVPGMVGEPEEAPKPTPSDLERIAKEYPDFLKRIDLKIEKYQRFHPSGVTIEGMTEEERMKWWAPASVIVKELTDMKNAVIANTKKRD